MPTAVARPGDEPPSFARPPPAPRDVLLLLHRLLVSGYAQPEDLKKAIEAGFDAHVAKPPDIGELQRLLE